MFYVIAVGWSSRETVLMNWDVVGEIVKVSGAVATAAAAWFAAVTAYRGLEKWRSENLGKRKAELAASVLANVYEAETVLRAAREPWVLPHERTKQQGVADEITENSNYVPERRLLQ